MQSRTPPLRFRIDTTSSIAHSGDSPCPNLHSNMGKPRLIILIRHAQSEGNKNRAIHQMVPDHRVKLTDEGWKQVHHSLAPTTHGLYRLTSDHRQKMQANDFAISSAPTTAYKSLPPRIAARGKRRKASSGP